MVNTILAKRVNHIVAKGDNPAWPKGSKSRGFSSLRRFTRSFFFLSISLLLFGAFGARFIESNDLAPKLRHITDKAIANKEKISHIYKILYFNRFLSLLLPVFAACLLSEKVVFLCLTFRCSMCTSLIINSIAL